MAEFIPEAYVFGLFDTGLGVIRSLGQKNIRISGVDYKKDIAWYSKYVKPELCPNPIANEIDFINWIRQKFNKITKPVPAFITGDDFLIAFIRNRKLLSRFFLFNIASNELLISIADKYSQFSLAKIAGIPVPETWILSGHNALDSLYKNEKWPLLVKGRDVNEWRALFGGSKKVFLANSLREMQEITKPALENQISIIAQEVIPGPDTHHFKYCAYISSDGEILAEFCLQKIRQNPIHFGIGCSVISVEYKELIQLGREFFKSINYRGVGSAEFKLDENDRSLKLIELNPRYWQQNALATACNVNFAYINYLDLLGENVNPQIRYADGIKWINIYSDLNSFLSYRKVGQLNLAGWLKSLRGPMIMSYFSWRDPLPSIKELGFGKRILRIPGYLKRNRAL